MDTADTAQPDTWHRQLAARLFNSTWDLIEKADRSDDDDTEMLLGAAASRWHWGQVGGPEQIAGGDWQVAHVAALLGLGDLAQRFASRNLALARAQGWDGWRLASAHEAMARACAAGGDGEGRATHVAAARAALDREPDSEERQTIGEQLATVPDVP